MSVFHFVLLRFTFCSNACELLADHESEGSPDFGVNTQHSYIYPINFTDVDVNIASVQGRDVLKYALEDYSQQVSDLQKQLREVSVYPVWP